MSQEIQGSFGSEEESSVKEEVPRYSHDCTDCVFLGRWTFVDLYFHPNADKALQTVVARWGNDGPDYESGIGLPTVGCYEATKRATERGFLPDEVLRLYV